MWRDCWRKTNKHIDVKHKAAVLLWIYAIKFNNHNILWDGITSRKGHYTAKLASKIHLSLVNTWMYSWHVLDIGDESWMGEWRALSCCWAAKYYFMRTGLHWNKFFTRYFSGAQILLAIPKYFDLCRTPFAFPGDTCAFRSFSVLGSRILAWGVWLGSFYLGNWFASCIRLHCTLHHTPKPLDFRVTQFLFRAIHPLKV